MDITFVAPDLRRLDELRADALVLPFFESERPLRGAASLIDWRLRGQFSKLRHRGRLTGAWLERVLVPGRPLTSFDKIFLLGLGARDEMSVERAEIASHAMFALLDACLARSAALVLAGRSEGSLDAETALEAFLRAASGAHEQDQIIVIEADDEHRALTLSLERERRKARASSSA